MPDSPPPESAPYSEARRPRVGSAPRQDREVEVLGEAVGLEVALLEARPALEDPWVCENRVGTDPRQKPAEHVVLLDDILGELPLADSLDNVRARESRHVPEFGKRDVGPGVPSAGRSDRVS